MSNQSKFKTGLKWFILLVVAVIVGSVIFGLINWAKSSNTGICATSNYKVVVSITPPNESPTATNLQKTDPDWCDSPPGYFFSWTYSDPNDDTESRFDFQIDNNSNFSSPEVNRSYTGLSNPSPTTNNQSVLVATSALPDYLTYNQTTYYWRVNVFDSNGADSEWVSGDSFTSAIHHYPEPDFSWLPASPFAEEEVQFTDDTTYYGGSIGSAWSWTFEDGNPSSSTQQNPKTVFQSSNGKQVNLTATDSDGYSCSVSDTVSIGSSLPWWKEIIPW